ncbi:uncharacterized protein EV422DRAFT_365850 [Fimicolochytrium jonesii]|uniref:uncharacterized protein n=1 Tax=Fimicolochytrium jonesii TaxID=1396493 RepID=UPI0022FEA66D|nr:uncharacterized protein EV422DRAFT_365850 [Fimicolochytrium jonesii]KAI8823674.1 hypothetical protein EV422DRAFT_365850 [Fimicolochytrium jonesii]
MSPTTHPRSIGLYESTSLSKRNGETFFLVWSGVWIALLAFIVLSEAYESFTPWSYMHVGMFVAIPPCVLPLMFPGWCDDPALPWRRRYTTKANVWIGVYSFVGNYLWTHYFYHILHVKYTFDAHRLNDVPFALYLITHGYFHFYHVISSRLLRIVSRTGPATTTLLRQSCVVLALSYATAFMEAFTIQGFPYYAYPDQRAMFTVGSLFYALYFCVSFPMFYRLDERVCQMWTMRRTLTDVLAACMGVTLLLDAWRIVVGPIAVVGVVDGAGSPGPLPWMATTSAK